MTAPEIQVTLHLKSGGGRRVLSGHPWIFSNEITPPAAPTEPGCLATVLDERDQFVGYATYNSHSLIALRILSRHRDEIPGSGDWFEFRLREALKFRERLFPQRRSYRLVHGEADGLPGVVIDRYEEVLAVQVLTAGMERWLEPLREALRRLLSPRAIVLRNRVEVRRLEGLEEYDRVAWGELPAPLRIEEGGVRFEVDVLQGQKTGHFFDQAENRAALAPYAQNAEVLDLFSYTAAWSLSLLRAGARRAVVIDFSRSALDLARNNARLNGLEDRMECVEAEVFAWLSERRRIQDAYDIVVVDPPAFAKNAKQLNKALRGYEDVNRQAIHLVREGGVLCSCSCSYHVSEEAFLEMLHRAATRERRRIRLLEIRGQARDHPVLLAMPESRYLKCVIGVVNQM